MWMRNSLSLALNFASAERMVPHLNCCKRWSRIHHFYIKKHMLTNDQSYYHTLKVNHIWLYHKQLKESGHFLWAVPFQRWRCFYFGYWILATIPSPWPTFRRKNVQILEQIKERDPIWNYASIRFCLNAHLHTALTLSGHSIFFILTYIHKSGWREA